MWVLFNIFIVMMYTGAAVVQYGAIASPNRNSKHIMLEMGLFAILGHAGLLYHWIDIGGGQNLTTLNLFSLITWLIALLMLVLVAFKPLENLGVVIFPLAAASIILAVAIPGHHVIQTANDLPGLGHILLSVLSISVLVLALIQAFLLAMQQQRLRFKHANSIWNKLPPIETMETILFQLIALGFLLLTVLLVTSFYFYHAILWHQFLNKSILAMSTWLVFAVLLLGRLCFGWRGKKAVYCTLAGIVLLMLTFFSSSLLIGYFS